MTIYIVVCISSISLRKEIIIYHYFSSIQSLAQQFQSLQSCIQYKQFKVCVFCPHSLLHSINHSNRQQLLRNMKPTDQTLFYVYNYAALVIVFLDCYTRYSMNAYNRFIFYVTINEILLDFPFNKNIYKTCRYNLTQLHLYLP